MIGMVQNDNNITDGTFAVPRYHLDPTRPEYKAVKALFNQIEWRQKTPRKDFLQNRFNAFCTIIAAVRSDPENIFHTIQNKSHHDINKWPTPYRAVKDIMDMLINLGWIVRHGHRKRYRNYRYKALSASPLLRLNVETIKLSELYWEPPVVSIRRGDTDLDKAPLDVELMANPQWKAWIGKHLVPKMDALNDKLLDHEFVLFPFGKADYDVQPQYQRIYTNTSGFKEEPSLLHGRIYPRNFQLPNKKQGWRQMTLIDGQPTIEVDVHASSLTLLSNDYYLGFDLPETQDLYQYGLLANLDRELVKLVTQVMINGVAYDRSGWPPSLKEEKAELIGDQKWADYVKPLIETYPSLTKLREHMGLHLMLTEAEVIIHAMNYLLDRGIGCLSLHDCLIVPNHNAQDAVEAFNDAYDRFHMQRPILHIG